MEDRVSPSEQRVVRAGTLVLQTSRDGDTLTIGLRGELDLANADALKAELDEALGDGACGIVVDMAELTFIDSTGIALLVNALGHDGADGRLRFVPSQAPAVSRVLKLTGIDERLPFATSSGSGEAGGLGAG
jgi:anti-anti-sigma factor